jgi:predicted permease
MWFSKRLRARDELSFHRDKLIEDYVTAGMDRRAAERRAFLEFGNMATIEETSRDVRGRWLEDFVKDLRYAFRTLRRSPAFTTVAVVSLALAIGANSAIFSLVNAVLLRPLPVDEPSRLVQITRLTPEGRAVNVSYPLFEHLRDNVRSISGAFVHWTANDSIVVDGEQEFVIADTVSGAYFDVLGVRPAAGRLLVPADDSLSASSPAAVISDRYWQRRFGRSPSAIGKTFRMRDRVFTIVGVMPPRFQSVRMGNAPDLVLPLLLVMNEEQRTAATNNSLRLIARLKPGATIEQVNAETPVIWKSFIEPLAAQIPGSLQSEMRSRQVGALPASDGINPFRDDLALPLMILMGIVVFILLLAAVNLSGLLVARGAARQREISIRLAIGAGRGRLTRQFLTESLVLASIGGGLGLILAGQLGTALAGFFLSGQELELSVAPDWHVVGFTAAVAVAACLVAGLLPALQAARANLNPALKEVRAHGHGRLSRVLVATQVAISMVLVVAATLFVGTLVKLYAVERGFDSTGVLIVNVRSTAPFPADRRVAVVRAVLDRLNQMPDVHSVTAAQHLPISGNDWTRSIELPADAARPGESKTAFNVIAPGYFATMGTAIRAGRDFNERDDPSRPPVAIVNESFARQFFGSQSPLGRRVTSLTVPYEIVGVVRDAVYTDLRDGVRGTLYTPFAYRDDQPANYKFLVRVAAGNPTRLAAELDRVLREADPALRVRSIMPYSTLVEQSIPAERILATIGGLFGVLALVIAGIGIFALLAFQVARRTNELGVRMVLGATRGSMIGMVLKDVAWMLVPGIALGAGAALMVTGLARGILFGLTPTDPTVFAIAASVLTLAAVAAAWLPARRASRVDPLTALRHE